MISDFHSDYSLCDADDAVVMKDIYPIPILIANSEFLTFRLNSWNYLIWKSAANITWWVYWMRNRGLLLPFFGPFFIQVSLLTNWPVLSNFIIWKCTVEKGQRNDERYPIPTLIADSEFCRDSWSYLSIHRTVWSTLIWPAMSNFIIWKCTVEKIKQMQWRKASNPDS